MQLETRVRISLAHLCVIVEKILLFLICIIFLECTHYTFFTFLANILPSSMVVYGCIICTLKKKAYYFFRLLLGKGVYEIKF